jgi:undecaprenyl-diphosphatase
MLYVVATMIAVIVLVPYAEKFAESLTELRNADLLDAAIVCIMTFITYLFGALSIHGSVNQELSYRNTLLVQFSSAFVNRLTPAGVGGFALYGRYLQKTGLSLAKASTAVGVNIFASVTSTIFLLALCAVILSDAELLRNANPLSGQTFFLLFAGILLVGAIVYSIKSMRNKIINFFRDGLEGLQNVSNPRKLLQLFAGNLGMSFFYGLALYFSLQAFDVSISPFLSYTVYQIGTTTGTAIPTPGGLGGVEAAVTAGLTAVGIELTKAFAAVVLFRVITFWATTIIGFVCFRIVQKRKLI